MSKTKKIFLFAVSCFFVGLIFVVLYVNHLKISLPFESGLSFIRRRRHFTPSNDTNIIFILNSRSTDLTDLQLCTVESACRYYPNNTIQLFVQECFDEEHARKQLDMCEFLNFTRIDYEKIFADTPLMDWYKSGVYHKSPYSIVELSDAARLAILYKQGGTYMDLDYISVQQIPSSMKNIIARQLDVKSDSDFAQSLNNAILRFEKGNLFLQQLLHDFVKYYAIEPWGNNGPELITRTKTTLEKMNSTLLNGLVVGPQPQFYPLQCCDQFGPNAPFQELSKVSDHLKKLVYDAYGVHIYSKSELMKEDSFQHDMMKKKCPVTASLLKFPQTKTEREKQAEMRLKD
ncbi:hypothetical protein C9374_004229 [Naegleria lovaniensis]|uniref:Alpha 1,4-glycosyltransferase domain-containing protein n=1 Tax=Naegleria lovaniensis TaxID=51637 RepID=A0AA88GSA7_NAELO|nr:uncharacterized protein C9374_004229 [Naegleria lovaniensis]KAG2383558.1 hypothetical protein C9374_004229 [Naegleria lovaniensis]